VQVAGTHPSLELVELTKLNDQYMLVIELGELNELADKLGELRKLNAKLGELTKLSDQYYWS
jgi:hypothetical protein